MSINNSGGPPSSSASNWRDLLTARQQVTQEQATLRVGETVQARVQALLPPPQDGSTPANSGQNRLILEVGGKLFETVTSLSVKPGDVINLSLQSNQHVLLQPTTGATASSAVSALLKALLPQTLLELPSTTTTSQPQPQRVFDALARVMPFQGRLLETLGKLLEQPSDTLPPKAKLALQQLRTAIPQANDLSTPEGLKQALRNSGAFAEKQWQASPVTSSMEAATGGHTLPRDLKTALVNLFAALSRPVPTANPSTPTAQPSTAPLTPAWQPVSSQIPQPLMFPHPEFLKLQTVNSRKEELSTGDMLKLVAQALSRIQTTQLNAIQQNQTMPDAAPVNSWLLELPVLNQQQLNLFQLRIDEDPQRQEQGDKNERKQESIWRLTLSFNLEPLGPMYSLVRIQSGRVSSTFWAEKDSTKILLERELPQLRKALVGLGLDVESLEALQGQPSFTQTRLETSLIDVRT